MTTGEHKSRLFVLRQGKGRWPIAFEGVTAVASVEVRRSGKLSGVTIAVAIGAAVELDSVQRVLPFRDVALRALEPRVAALQRIRSGGMFLYGELRRLPSINCVARGALSTIGTLHELPVVRVLMAIHAFGKD